MNDKITLEVIKVIQPIGEVYIGKMDAERLFRMSTVDRRHINNDDEVIGVQRPLIPEKVKEIQKYLKTQNATFPNSIIVNVRKEDAKIVSSNDDKGLAKIELRNEDDIFTIIDGQHRLFGFENYNGKPFELILTIFIGLEEPLQSDVFTIINSEQTKVDPSLSINLALSDKTETPRKKLVQIAQSFNIDEESPWYHQIKMLGSQSEGIISLAAFVRPLFNLTYPEKMLIDIKNRLNQYYPEFPDFKCLPVDSQRYPFWPLYVSQNPSVIYKILLNYFRAFKQVLSDDWMNQESILNKTSGYNAMIRLLRTLIPIGLRMGSLSETFFLQKLSPLSKMSGSITSEFYGSSGLYSSNALYRDMLKEINLS